MTPRQLTQLNERLEAANKFVFSIATNGRRFFAFDHAGNVEVARFYRDECGKIWFWNEWKRKWIYVSRYCEWKDFHHGGTLHALVGNLVEFIRKGHKLHASFFGPHWAYGSDIDNVINEGIALGVIQDEDALATEGGRTPDGSTVSESETTSDSAD